MKIAWFLAVHRPRLMLALFVLVFIHCHHAGICCITTQRGAIDRLSGECSCIAAVYGLITGAMRHRPCPWQSVIYVRAIFYSYRWGLYKPKVYFRMSEMFSSVSLVSKDEFAKFSALCVRLYMKIWQMFFNCQRHKLRGKMLKASVSPIALTT